MPAAIQLASSSYLGNLRFVPGQRRCLFLEHEIAAWLEGATLGACDLPQGRVVAVKARL